MTQNLNVWFANAEQARANKVREMETERHNRMLELEEMRANRARETHNVNVLAENIRHSVASEQQAARDLRERNRAAVASEKLRGSELAESTRAHTASERNTRYATTQHTMLTTQQQKETHRANIASELLRGTDIANTAMYREQQVALEQAKLQQNLLLDSRRIAAQEEANRLTSQRLRNELALGIANVASNFIVGSGRNATSVMSLLMRGSY